MKTKYQLKEIAKYALFYSITLTIILGSMYTPNIILDNGIPWGIDNISSWKATY